MKTMNFLSTIGKSILSHKLITVIVVLIIGIGGGVVLRNLNKPAPQRITVTRGSIIETVSLTGNTTPAESVALAFGSSGTISRTYSGLGKQAYAGQVLAELNTSDLTAGLHQAEANVAIQQARLDGLKSGSRPEDIAVSQSAVNKAKQDLANLYFGIGDTSIDSYAKANDAVRTELDQLFSNGDTTGAKLTYLTLNNQAQTDAESERFSASVALNAWQNALTSVDQSNVGLESLLQSELSHLAFVRQLLTNVSKTLDTTPSLSATTLATYKANVSAALTEVNTAAKNLNTISQNISSQKLTVSQLQAALDLKRAGSLPTDISAQRAELDQAVASVESAKAKLANGRIIAPMSGTVTQFDAKIGQIASPSTPLVSIMSHAGYEVDSGVSETDIGKLSLANSVSMTLDAFPNETFDGSVFSIAPSETNVQGVISFQVKISFANPDPRLKSGLTANIDIQTKQKNNVLILPQYAILQNDQGTFVQTLENGKTVERAVTLGIQDRKGNVEVLSGVIEGEQVLNIGLKKP